MIDKLEKIAAAGIQIVSSEPASYFVFERDGFIALVENVDQGFGSIGSAGIMTEGGLAVLVWRDSQPFFVAKGLKQPATPEQVTQLRDFATGLKNALS